MPVSLSVPVKSRLVDWLPWSVLNISGVAFRDLDAEEMARAGLSAPLHKGVARYFRETGPN